MLTHASILVVDDFAAMRDILVAQLKSMGCAHIHKATNATDALRLLDTLSVDLVLSDWSMPGMSGLEFLVALRSRERLRHLPFIMVTAELQRDRVAEAIRAGVHDFLLKPFKPAEFSRKVQDALFGRPRNAALHPPAPTTPAPAPGTPTRATVLVVDDLPDNLTLASGLLRERYTVKMATRGEKALQLCQATPPDLVLLDIMMPGMDGFEVCRRLQADPVTAAIPVIFLTALDDVDKTVAGLGLGAVDYVTKPIEPEVLLARVATALRLSQAREDLRAQYDLAVENARLREEVERITRHDLKNPIAAIIGATGALLAHTALTDAQTHQIQAIEQTAYDMLGLIDLSNELFRMKQGRYQLQPQPVDLPALVLRVAQECRQSFAAKGIGVDTRLPGPAGPAVVQGDPLLLYSMLHNLARNAGEAIQPGQSFRLTLDLDTHCHLGIHNPGQVPPAMVERFFEKFATHGKPGGTGLGTYSARLIAQAHGGTVALQTSDAQGTTVTVTLPRAKA